MAEIGRLDDPRCQKALDLLEGKQLPGSGWARSDGCMPYRRA